jgi:4-hydroxy-3-polyprenylbenzoate decarboxylase
MAIDATTKIGPEKRHEWGKPLTRDTELENKVDARWQELGLADLGSDEPDPSLFGYVMESLHRQATNTKT